MPRYKYNITTSAVPSECLGQKIHLLPYFILYLKPFYNSSTHSKVNDIKYASYTPTLIFNLLKDSLLIALRYKRVMNRIDIPSLSFLPSPGFDGQKCVVFSWYVKYVFYQISLLHNFIGV